MTYLFEANDIAAVRQRLVSTGYDRAGVQDSFAHTLLRYLSECLIRAHDERPAGYCAPHSLSTTGEKAA